jgi:hypothetical protein
MIADGLQTQNFGIGIALLSTKQLKVTQNEITVTATEHFAVL